MRERDRTVLNDEEIKQLSGFKMAKSENCNAELLYKNLFKPLVKCSKDPDLEPDS
jgi:hypothetical protein